MQMLEQQAGGARGHELHVSSLLPSEASQPALHGSTAATYALFLIFGWGSWLTINGIFTELPLLVAELPEGWRLASIINMAVQLANVGPLAFYLLRARVLRRGSHDDSLARRATYLVLLVGGAGGMLTLAACWSFTARVLGSTHSVALLLLTFVAALADCTSSVLFWRFVSSFRSVHISALSAGEGLSGVLTSGLVWVQGASLEQPRFSAGVYFLALAALMCASTAAFHLLLTARFVDSERVAGPLEGRAGSEEAARSLRPASDRPGAKAGELGGLLALQAWLNAMQNGVMVSCLCLAAKPYGRSTLQVAQTASLFVDPLSAAAGFRIPVGARGLLAVTVVITAMSAYTLVTSLDSVAPPLLDSGGGALLVCLTFVCRALTAYSKMRANVLLRGEGQPAAEAQGRMVLAGVATQSGAFLGAGTMFVLINFTAAFRSAG